MKGKFSKEKSSEMVLDKHLRRINALGYKGVEFGSVWSSGWSLPAYKQWVFQKGSYWCLKHLATDSYSSYKLL